MQRLLPWLPPPDGSRDLRIEDPTNPWFVHLICRMLLPLALRLRMSANAVSVGGLAAGAGAAWAYWNWDEPGRATLGFLLSIGWLVLDGLDGMVARARGTASAFGRFMDGLCDHGVFVLIYLSVAASIGTIEGWVLAIAAGAAHGLQASLYEGERTRFHRRIKGDPGALSKPKPPNPLVRGYDAIAGAFDRMAQPFDRKLAATPERERLAARYGERAAPALKLMFPLSNNMRVLALYLACLAGNPRYFWWFELIPLTALAAAGILRHRRIEARLVREVREGAG